MRADRLLSIVWLLRAHGQLTTAVLAERLEVSRRTILRDVEALSAAGVPVYCERGPLGGVNLLPGYRTDVTALSSEESRALFAAATTWGADALGLGDALASGLRKLLAAVPERHRDLSSEVAARVVVDPEGWLPRPESERISATFGIVQEAVFTRRRLRLDYRHDGRASVTATVVDPHGLVSAGRSWYLCASRDGVVTFLKLTRIDQAELLAEPCETGADVDVRTAWDAQRERFRGGFTPVVASVWVRDDRWVDAHEWAIRAAEAEPTSPPPPGAGWTFLELEFMDDLHAMTFLLRLGPDVYVVSPHELRRELVEYLTRTQRLYPDQ